MRFKLDENLDVALAAWLASLGHDATTVRDELLSGASDDRVFQEALIEKRCLITLDLDFSDPLRFSPTATAGTVVLRAPVPSMTMIKMLLAQAITRAEIDSPNGQIWIVEPSRIRIWESWDVE